MNLQWLKQEINRVFCALYQRTHIEVIIAYDDINKTRNLMDFVLQLYMFS